MKNHTALYGSAAALVAGGLILAWSSTGNRPVSSSAIPTPSPSGQETAEAPDAKPVNALVQAGTLWELEADTPREAERSSIQVAAEPLKAALTSPPGSRLQLALSPKFAPLAATVTSSHDHEDGTVVTTLRIEGAPNGTLILQENAAAGFFLGQLYYDGGYPIAYEFRKSSGEITATRHAVSELICSKLNPNMERVEAMGLPPVKSAGVSATPMAAPIAKAPVAKAAKIKGPLIAVSDVTVAEGDSGTSNLTFNVRLSKADRKKTITVDFSTANGTALAGTDYTATSGTVTFAPKTTVQTITIPVLTDTTPETNKSFTINLSNPANATLVNSTATGTIIDDDAPPTISASDVSVTEGDTGGKKLQIQVSLNQAYVSTVRVYCATSDDPDEENSNRALAGYDYKAASGTLVFAPGETTKVFSTTVLGDYESEGSETFFIDLSNAEGGTISNSRSVATILDNDLLAQTIPVLDSKPEAAAVIYLDMDGQEVTGTSWNSSSGYQMINASGIESYFTREQMEEIWKQVKEDFAPFNVNVTTNENAYEAAPPQRRIRCVITPYSSWFGDAGGVAYLDSFSWTGDTPCWVFVNNLAYYPKFIAEAVSHEAGHTLDLEHDGTIKPDEEYYYGHGVGDVSWAPIMGVGYYSSLVQWSKGEYSSSTNTEDDLAIIEASIRGNTNESGYEDDDFGGNKTTATAMIVNDPPLPVNGATLSASGVIGNREDVDVFSFTTTGGGAWFKADGDSTSPNLDISITVYNSSGQIVATANPDRKTNASLSFSLAAGTYYLHITGEGRGVATESGYSDYGSIGQYTILGVAP